MPKLWILSDLHLEADPNPEAFKPKPPEFDILVVAGDVWEGDCARGFRTAIELSTGKPVIFILGNHEFWNGVHHEELEVAKLLAQHSGVTLLENSGVEICGVHFIGGTLWADGRLGDLEDQPRAETGEQIDIDHGSGTHLMTVGDMAKLHAKARLSLERLLPKSGEKPVVVVTHHAPHPVCLPASKRNRWSAGRYASDLAHLTDNGRIDLWIHGHVHETVDLVRPGGTRIICNPAGPRFSNPSFQPNLIVEV